MLTLLSVLLLLSHVSSLGQSAKCGTMEFEYNGRCCDACKPGQYMEKECEPGSKKTLCKSCSDGYYMSVHNNNYLWCHTCTKCTREHMKYEKECTTTNNAVCTCDEGYRCSDSSCEMCVKVPSTITSLPPTPAPTKAKQTTQDVANKCKQQGKRCNNSKCEKCVEIPKATTFPLPSAPAPTEITQTTQDNVWISVSLCFACVCVCVLLTCFLLTSRHAQTCGRIMSTSAGFWTAKKTNSRTSQCTDEEEVPMPVQEVCGKTETLEDV